MKRWLIALLCGPLPVAAQTAYVNTATQLRATPNADAEVLRALEPGAAVEIRARQGGWEQVTVSSQNGWVRMSALQLHAPGSAPGVLEGGRQFATQTVATTGVRGLGEGDLQNAVPDLAAADGLATYAATAEQARAFAGDAGLHAAAIPKEDR
ncbi:MAG: SH3 domain-containing protein [Nevskia sp.]|nr:SH3 domain-containing protein [Nevskia sp.]